ncbi:MAG: phosphatidylglycerophosphatase A [Acidobacteria bacterium]|nr:phosphatidylglycerophosphatase A [Acidobacteriota bacterium]
MSENGSKPAPRWAWWVATGLGSGRLHPAPGTWGSLAGAAAWVVLAALVALPLDRWSRRHGLEAGFWVGHGLLELFFLALPLGMAWLAVRASDLVVAETGDKDPGWIVADEWAGVFVALWSVRLLLVGNLHRVLLPGGWRWALLPLIPFLLFRLLDIWKPWPCRRLQDLPGGQGIVADDLVAGLYTIPLTQILLPFLLAR